MINTNFIWYQCIIWHSLNTTGCKQQRSTSWVARGGSCTVHFAVASPCKLLGSPSLPLTVLSFQEQCKKMIDERPQLVLLATVLDFQLTILQFIFLIRSEANDLGVCHVLIWMCAMDFLSVLEETYPDTVHHFYSGSFVSRKTKRFFSCYCIGSRADLLI